MNNSVRDKLQKSVSPMSPMCHSALLLSNVTGRRMSFAQRSNTSNWWHPHNSHSGKNCTKLSICAHFCCSFWDFLRKSKTLLEFSLPKYLVREALLCTLKSLHWNRYIEIVPSSFWCLPNGVIQILLLLARGSDLSNKLVKDLRPLYGNAAVSTPLYIRSDLADYKNNHKLTKPHQLGKKSCL